MGEKLEKYIADKRKRIFGRRIGEAEKITITKNRNGYFAVTIETEDEVYFVPNAEPGKIGRALPWKRRKGIVLNDLLFMESEKRGVKFHYIKGIKDGRGNAAGFVSDGGEDCGEVIEEIMTETEPPYEK